MLNATVSLVDKMYEIKLLKFDRDDVEAIKTITGRRWNDKRKAWRIPVTQLASAELKEMMKARSWTSTPAVTSTIDAEIGSAAELSSLSRSEDAELPVDVPIIGALRPFQRAGVAFALKARRVLIADEMGLGKTIQAIAVAEAGGNTYPVVVVCPASLKINWKREFEKWTDKRVMVLYGKRHTKGAWRGADVLVVNYDLVSDSYEEKTKSASGMPKLKRRYPLVEQILEQFNPKMVVLDESHYIKSKSALRTKACLELTEDVPWRVALSGTAIMNRPVELYPQLQALGQFARTFGTFARFASTYCSPKDTPWGIKYDGADNLDDLNKRLRSTCMVRRLKKDVLQELPAKQRSLIPLEMDPKILREYEKAQDDVIDYLAEIDLDRANAAMRAEVLVKFEVLKQLAVRGVMAKVKAWVRDFLDSGEKLVLFGHHKEFIGEMVDEFSKERRGYAMQITGDTSMEDRQKAVDMFQDPRGVCRLLVCNIKAGGVGLTLTAASNVAFFELAWTPAELDQAEDRVHRYGQQDSVTAWYLMAMGTVMETIMKLVDKKRQVVNAAMDGVAGNHAPRGESIAGDLVKELRRARAARKQRSQTHQEQP